MKDITEFKAWLNKEISQYPLIAKSNPLSLNELCYALRLSGKDFAVCWNNDSGFSCIPSIAESYIPSRDLSLKVKLVDYDSADESEDIEGCLRVEIIRKVIRSSADIEKALEDWGRELTEIHTLLGCCELLAGMAEEAAELSQAALKLRRTIDKSNPTPVSTGEASHKLNEEFADVVLCAAALGLDREEVERFIREKAARWSMRLEVDE